MIQRIQTLWLLLATIAVFLTLQFPFYSGTLISNSSFHSFIAKEYFLLMVLTSALGTALLINIFLFKQRSIQFKICVIALLVEGLLLFIYYRHTKLYSQGTLSWSAIFHVVTIVALLLAARGIYKDSKLIKDSNRLR